MTASNPVAVYVPVPSEATVAAPVKLLSVLTSSGAGVFTSVVAVVLSSAAVAAAKLPPVMIDWLLPLTMVKVGAAWL